MAADAHDAREPWACSGVLEYMAPDACNACWPSAGDAGACKGGFRVFPWSAWRLMLMMLAGSRPYGGCMAHGC